MKQGVKIYRSYDPKPDSDGRYKPITTLPSSSKAGPRWGRAGGSLLAFVQEDIRKQNQLGWYVHQMTSQPFQWYEKLKLGDEDRWYLREYPEMMVVYRRDEEM
jgi:hypothetical protein